jgi:hypothetical protein
MTVVTYGTVSRGHGGHPCVEAVTRPGPHQLSFDAGCFEGPHVGMIFGDVCGARVDANEDCGSAHMSFPNSHTTVYRFRPSQIGNPSSFFWQAWVLYPGDRIGGHRPQPGRPRKQARLELLDQAAAALTARFVVRLGTESLLPDGRRHDALSAPCGGGDATS